MIKDKKAFQKDANCPLANYVLHNEQVWTCREGGDGGRAGEFLHSGGGGGILYDEVQVEQIWTCFCEYTEWQTDRQRETTKNIIFGE